MIVVNGESMEWHPGLTVRDVLKNRNYRFPLLVVSINGELVQPKEYDVTVIDDGADVQAIHMLSGG